MGSAVLGRLPRLVSNLRTERAVRIAERSFTPLGLPGPSIRALARDMDRERQAEMFARWRREDRWARWRRLAVLLVGAWAGSKVKGEENV